MNDMFSFGGASMESALHPYGNRKDSEEIRRAIDLITMERFEDADGFLSNMAEEKRDARWYYLSAVANYRMGNNIRASEQIKEAVRLEPENRTYRRMQVYFRQTEHTYMRNRREYQGYGKGTQKLCAGVCAAEVVFVICCQRGIM